MALDVPTHAEAFGLVKRLPNVSFFKVGLELLMASNMLAFLQELQQQRGGGVFLDLKLSGDIGNTITRMVKACMRLNVKFITLAKTDPESMTVRTLEAAVRARGKNRYPRFLMVPLPSSQDADDLPESQSDQAMDDFIIAQSEHLLAQGCDGLIVSGPSIQACRKEFPDIDIVSPGIRPAGAAKDDHKRHTTPKQAIAMGADYLVVGRPITQAADPEAAAASIIDEIDEALEEKPEQSSPRASRASLLAAGAAI